MIDLDGDINDEYLDFTGGWYFAAEDTTGPDHRIIDFEPITTSSFENLVFSGDFAAGDTDSNPAYDSNHFIAVLYSTDGGSTYLPGLVFRHDGNNGGSQDATNQPLARVNVIAASGQNGINTLAQLGAQISTGVIAPDSTNTADIDNFIALDSNGFAAGGTQLTERLSSFTFAIPNASTVRLRVVMDMDDTNTEVAFDNFVLNGDPVLTNVAPSVNSSTAPDVTEASIGASSYQFSVTYSDDSAVDVSTIDTGSVSVSGTGGALNVTGVTLNINTDGTPRVATFTATPPGGTWNAADTGTYTVTQTGSDVGDDGGPQLFVAGGAITTFSVDATNEAPSVTDVLAEDVIFTDLGETSYTFTVEYTDTFHDIDVSTIDASDVAVTKGGGGTLTVTGVTTNPATDASPVTATYTVTPPGGSWDAGDNDTYTITLQGNQVDDILGESVAADPTLASFVVNSNKVLNETFETDGNGTRYSTTGEFSAGVHDYYTRVFDSNGNTAGGETPLIDLDDAIRDEYIDFDRRVYFAAEDVTAGGGGTTFRVLDIDPINTAAFHRPVIRGAVRCR